jgi:hypothetical protein
MMERGSSDERFDRLEALIKAEGGRLDSLVQSESAATRKQLRDKIALESASTRKELRDELAAEAASTRKELRDELAAEGANTRKELRDELALEGANTRKELRDEIAAEGASTRKQLREEIALSASKLGARMDTLQEQMKIVAEGHSVLVGHIVDMKGGIERLEAGQTSLVLRVSAVESRVTDIERTQKVVLAEVKGLAARK